jgi:hypothetical protein
VHVIRKVLKKIRQYQLDKEFARKERAINQVPPVKTIVQTVPGAHNGGRLRHNLCLMAHFDTHGRIAKYVQDYILELKALNFDIVLISTSPRVDSRDLDFARTHLRMLIHRQNVGLDFGSWKAALDSLPDAYDYEQLLLTNDSVFGPFYPLKNVFERFASMPEPLLGMTDSWETFYHLQSYFLLFKKDAFHSETFKNFWNSVKLSHDKNKIIDQYEVGISQKFIADDFTLGAYVPFHILREHCLALGPEKFQYYDMFCRQPGNPTIFMWDILISDFKFPFLKTELLKVNRKESKEVVHWRKILEKNAAQKHISSISAFLQRTQWNCRG